MARKWKDLHLSFYSTFDSYWDVERHFQKFVQDARRDGYCVQVSLGDSCVKKTARKNREGREIWEIPYSGIFARMADRVIWINGTNIKVLKERFPDV